MRLITIQQYFETANRPPMLDVRSPGEFKKGHLPAAKNLPLFDDEERAVVGTLYKQQGPEPAMMRGLEIAGRKMTGYVKLAQQLVEGKKVAVHCWRGGKRSASIATLLEFIGFEVQLVTGGYKAYRSFVLSSFTEKKLQILTLGGRTGSGKTEVLHYLRDLGEQIIDLEGLANHKGSAFGALGEAPQTTVEQFENNLFEVFWKLDASRPVWVENESQAIGKVFIPQGLWGQMNKSVFVELEIPVARRVERLVAEYGQFEPEALLASLQKISKRMGGQNVNAALEAFAAGDLHTATEFALKYYDRSYEHGTAKKEFAEKHRFEFGSIDSRYIAQQLFDFARSTDFQFAPSTKEAETQLNVG